MHRTFVSVTLLAVAALAAATFLLWGGGDRPAPGAPRAQVPAVGQHERAQASFVPPAPAPAGPLRPQVEARAVAPGAAAPVAAEGEPVGTAEAALLVTVRSRETGAPVPDVRVHVRPEDDRSWSARQVEGSEGRIAESPVTDAEGRCRFRVPTGRALVVEVPRGDTGPGRADVPPIRQGEEPEVAIEVDTRPDLIMVGRVVSDETGRPLADARVELVVHPQTRSFDAAGSERRRPGGTEVEVDASGRFEVRAGSWSNRQLDVRAPGHGTALVALERGHETDATALEVRLGRAATVVAHVSDVGGAPVEGAVVRLETEEHRLRAGLITSSISFGHVGWSGRTGADGRAVLRDVPARTPFAVTSTAPGEPRVRLAAHVTLEPGERRELFLRIGGGATLAGTLVDTGGASTGGLTVWLKPGEHERPHAFQPYESGEVRTASVDDSGRFVFEDVADGLWWVGCAPGGRYASPPEVVRVEDGAVSGDLRLEVTAGLRVGGVVLGPEGDPVPGAHVVASGPAGFANGPADGEGRFDLGPVPPGALSVWAGGRGRGFARSPSVEARAGDRELVLRLGVGGELRGVVLDGATGEPRQAEVTVAPSGDPGSLFGTLITSTGEDGTFSVDGLEPGTYDLSARTSGGQVAVRAAIEVAPGEASGEVSLRTQPGAVVVIRYLGPRVSVHCRLTTHGARVGATSAERGTSEPTAVPAGPLRVEVLGGDGTAVETRELQLAVGERRELVLGQAD